MGAWDCFGLGSAVAVGEVVDAGVVAYSFLRRKFYHPFDMSSISAFRAPRVVWLVQKACVGLASLPVS